MGYQGRALRITASTAIAFAVLMLGAVEAGAAAAQRHGPCADDLAKFCKDIQPGGGRIAQCLRQHEQELSPVCKQHVAEVKKRGQEFRAACEDDVLRLCGGIKPGGGRMAACLKQHEQELTPDCNAKMQQRHPKGK